MAGKEKKPFLFEMHHSFSYFDGDSTERDNERLYVLGIDREDAIGKFAPLLKKRKNECKRRKGSDERVEYNMVSLENLVVARDQSHDGGPGYYTQRLTEIRLALETDKNKYRLCVCLIPFNE